MWQGALDVWFTPVQMKENRPGVVVAVLAQPEQAGAVAGILLRETLTLGLRVSHVGRISAERCARPNTRTVRASRASIRSRSPRSSMR